MIPCLAPDPWTGVVWGTGVAAAALLPLLYLLYRALLLRREGGRLFNRWLFAYIGGVSGLAVVETLIIGSWVPVLILPFSPVLSTVLGLELVAMYEEKDVKPETLGVLGSNLLGALVLGYALGLRRILSFIAYFVWSALIGPVLLTVALWINTRYYRASIPVHTLLLLVLSQVYNPQPATHFLILALASGFVKVMEVSAPQFHMLMSNNILMWLVWLAGFVCLTEYSKEYEMFERRRFNPLDAWLVPAIATAPLPNVGTVVFGWTNVPVNVNIVWWTITLLFVQILWWENLDRPARFRQPIAGEIPLLEGFFAGYWAVVAIINILGSLTALRVLLGSNTDTRLIGLAVAGLGVGIALAVLVHQFYQAERWWAGAAAAGLLIAAGLLLPQLRPSTAFGKRVAGVEITAVFGSSAVLAGFDWVAVGLNAGILAYLLYRRRVGA